MFGLLARANELERKGKDIIHFEIGDPDFISPPEATLACVQSLSRGETHYTNSMGLLELREAIRRKTNADYGFEPDIEQILVCPANAVIDFTIRCVAEPGDRIIIPDPGFPTYFSAIAYNQMEAVRISLVEASGFRMSPQNIGGSLNSLYPLPKLIIINSPNNPTGAVMSKVDIDDIYYMANKFNIVLLSDEVYSKIIYGKRHYSACVRDQCRETTVLLQSMSKIYSMSGWRVGYAIGPIKLIEKMGLLLQTIISCLPAFTQFGAIEALERCDELIEARKEILRKRRNILIDGLNSLPGVSCAMPDGAFYAFANVAESGYSSVEFCNIILDKAGVCILPGDYFGENGIGYVRLSYASVDYKQIVEAIERMREILSTTVR
jgi:aspartate/methionine/tyrosine aminotransferase